MKWSSIKLNSIVWYQNQKYIIASISDPPEITLRRENDNVDRYITYSELMTDESYKAHKSQNEGTERESVRIESRLDALTEDEREIVKRKKEIILPLIIREKAKSGDLKFKTQFMENYSRYLKDNETLETLKQERLIEQISAETGLCKRHIKRLFYSFRRAERVKGGWGEEGLIPLTKQFRSCRKDEIPLVINHPRFPDKVLDTIYVRQDEEYIPILKEVIEKEYLNLRNVSDKKIYNIVAGRCKLKGITALSYTTIHHMLKSIDPKVIVSMRLGHKAASKYDDVELGFSNEALHPLHIIQIDHKLLDVIVIDDDTGAELGRPWLTIGLDLFSREIWSAYLSFEKLSANRVRKALEIGVFFKDTKGITKYTWDICGVPSIIQFDNGKDFRSFEVQRMVNEVLGSKIRFRPPKTPRYSGAIERFFRTLDTEVIHTLRGTTKGSVTEKGDLNSQMDAIITFSNLKRIIVKFIVDIYHRSEHKGLPPDSNIPAIRYYEGIRESGYPEVPEDEEKFKFELLFEDMRACTKEGVRYNNILYKPTGLSSLIKDGDDKYKIKYDIDDISKIYIQLPDSTEYVEAPAINPPADILKNKNLYVYEMGRKWLIKNGKIKKTQIPGADKIEEAWAELHEEIAKMYVNNASIRRKAKSAGFEVIPVIAQKKTKTKPEPSWLDRLDEAIINEK